ncbi:MAG: IclR family transcriptional regulator [Gammaproteobacteria bacterium]|nr:IclR family transcriptional regulator [Gammaproteobacteria bacterium]
MNKQNQRNAPAHQRLQVIERASKVLRALEGQSSGLSLGEIAKATDLPRSTVQRIVGALEAEQFVISATPKARVVLGPALLRLASSVKIDIVRLATPALQKLSADTGETVDLSVLQGTTAVFVYQLSGRHRLRAVSAVGDSFPLHCSACGKALLAVAGADLISTMASKPMPAYTENTITDLGALKENLKSFQKNALCFDEEEHTEGISAIGTAFIDPFGRAYAISIPVPTLRFDRLRESLEKSLIRCRSEILDAFGST